MDFNTFQGDNLSPENVQDLIENLEPKGGDRFIDKALKLANEQLFTAEAGMRDGDNNTLKVCHSIIMIVLNLVPRVYSAFKMAAGAI